MPKYGVNVEVVAVSDFMKGSVYCPDGLKLNELLEWDAAGLIRLYEPACAADRHLRRLW